MGGLLVPMKSFQRTWKNEHPSRKELTSTILYSVEVSSTKEATDRVVKILDSNYEKADLNKIVEDADNLDPKQKQMLLKSLEQFGALFDGTLRRWNTPSEY